MCAAAGGVAAAAGGVAAAAGGAAGGAAAAAMAAADADAGAAAALFEAAPAVLLLLPAANMPAHQEFKLAPLPIRAPETGRPPGTAGKFCSCTVCTTWFLIVCRDAMRVMSGLSMM